MPNWCNNRINITFPTALEAHAFEIACQHTPEREDPSSILDVIPAMEANPMAKYYPEPDYSDTQQWYNWRCDHWGTKWPADFDCIATGRTAMINCDTAWGPPIPWLEYCGITHGWMWELSYIETGMAFAGDFEGGPDGITSHDEYSSPSPDYEAQYDDFGFERYEEEEVP